MEIGLVRRIAFTIIACLGIMACATPGDASLDETTQAVVGPSVTTDAPSYVVGATVNVSYMNMPGNRLDWVAVSRAGSPATSYVKYFYTNGQVNGTQAFNGLAAGNYEARVYQNNTYTMLASSPFTIGVKPTLTTDQSTYAPSSPVTVTYTNMPGDPGETIAISLAGSPDSQTVVTFPTGGATSGSHQFTGLANGSYEARGYSNGVVVARHAFAISGANVSPDSPSYSVGQTVTVTYSGLPGNSTDWVSVALVGSPDTSYVQWHYTGGATSGTMQFTNLLQRDTAARNSR